jgi:hypothetical protein
MLNFVFCSVSSQIWRGRIHQIAPAALFPWLGTLWLLPIRLLEERTSSDEFQISKWGDICGDRDFERNPNLDALRSVQAMAREITRVHYKWWGVCLSNYQWANVLFLLVREIGYAARTSRTPCIICELAAFLTSNLQVSIVISCLMYMGTITSDPKWPQKRSLLNCCLRTSRIFGYFSMGLNRPSLFLIL